MQLVGCVAVVALSALLVAFSASAERTWVGCKVPLNLRSGPGNQFRILRQVKGGDSVHLLERGGNWTKIRTAGGEEGWIAAGYLDPVPPPTLRLEELETEVEDLRNSLEKTKTEASSLRQRSEELAANDSEQKTEIERLTKENYRLHAGERWAEWITGALVLSTGMVLGALLSRLSSRRHRQRLRL
jgi:SH3 domain protein